jgi:tight adherence protein B
MSVTMSRRLTATLAAVLCAAATAAPAAAAAGPQISPAGNAAFPERAYSLRIPSELALSASNVQVRENGQQIGDVNVASARQASRGEFGTVLVIDASQSMRGAPIRGAMKAAQAFADRRTTEQELGVVTFNRDVSVALPPTTDDTAINQILSQQPRLAASTHLYDAVAEAVRSLEGQGISNGSVVVLSDGRDIGSSATLDQVVRLARAAGVRVFVVGLQSIRFDPAALKRLAGSGTYADARRPQQLSGIFDALGSKLAREYLVTYQSQADPGERVTVEMDVNGVAGTGRDSYTARPPAAAVPPASENDSGFWRSTAAMVAAAASAALLLMLAIVVVARPRPESLPQRLARFVSVGPAVEDEEGPRVRAGLLGKLEEAVEDHPRWKRFAQELDVAQIDTPAVQIAVGTAIATLLAVLLIGAITGLAILAPLGLLVALVVRGEINRRVKRRRTEFADQLSDNLQVVASAIRAGHSMVGAFSVVVDEASEPSRSEFRRIVNDERLGVPLEEAIRRVARRMDNRDLDQVALVATIQRETGGNTAEVLDRVIQTIRQRGEIRRLMETMTAQGRLSRVVVTAIPPVLLVAISLINPEYLRPLFHTGTGNLLLGIAAGLVVMGSLVIKRIVNIKV